MSPWGFWTFNNKNGLAGLASTTEELPDGRIVTVKDPDNPAVLEPEFIAHALRTSRQARYDFNRLFPSLQADEQERLADIIIQNPRATALLQDDQTFHDILQQRGVTEGVRSRIATRVPQIAVRDRTETS